MKLVVVNWGFGEEDLNFVELEDDISFDDAINIKLR